MSELNKCKALIQQGPRKGTLCGNYTDKEYCIKHIRQTIIDKAKIESIKYCDVSRGCFTVLEEHQSKCIHCLQKARIRDRKREDKKRQDDSLCLDCGNTLTSSNRAIGKHDKELRRCKPCYEKLQLIESKRERPERNYKAEAFHNKYVIWNHYVKGAKKRGIDFTISKTNFNELIILPCFYCNYTVSGEVNGIDRIDNNKGYIEDNVVSCCQTCNTLKGSQHPQEFIDKINAIYTYINTNISIDKELIDKWKSTYLSKCTPKYNNYKNSAISRNLLFEITVEDFNKIISGSCYLCGIISSEENINGIDRFDNNIGYTLENCRTCCGHCNILKKNISFNKIIAVAKEITNKYNELAKYFNEYEIKVRESKIEKRVKIENPIVMDIEHKPINEIIIPKVEVSSDIKEILEQPKHKLVKQWKVKQIFEAITTNKENTYREYCEKNNDVSKIENWNTYWAEFVSSIKDKPLNDAEKIIREFIESLRRIRHNTLCYEKNSKIVDREDRQQWTSMSIVRAFQDSKIDIFKKYTEEQSGDNPDCPSWQKRWNTFITSLEENKDNPDKLKDICSSFLTAQRIKRYRRSISP